MALASTTKQAIIWGLVIVFGGGVLSWALGQGFWGEKAPSTVSGVVDGDVKIPTRAAVCETGEPCSKCHPDK